MGTLHLAEVLFGKTRRQILLLLLNRPDESFYFRQIQRETGAGLGALQRELKQLSDTGIIIRSVKGSQIHYQADRSFPGFSDLKDLISLEVAAPERAPDSIFKSHAHISIPREKIVEFSKRHHIRKLSLFGSVLRDDFQPESDIDVLVEFEPEHMPGFLGIIAMESELSADLAGRKIDIRTPQELSRYFREKVVRESEVQYDASRR